MNDLILKLHEELLSKQKQIDKMQKEIDCLYKALQEQNKMTDEQIEKAFTIASEHIYKSKNEEAREMIRFIAYNSERPLTLTELNKVYNILGDDNNE